MATIQERIKAGIKVNEAGCWMWQLNKSTKGYGQITMGSRTDKTRRTVPAYRASYEAFNSVIPEGLQLDHLCRVHACVNPDHLEPVTRTENIRRGLVGVLRPVRTHCSKGHELVEGNVYRKRNVNGSFSTSCATCSRTYTKEYYAKFKKVMV